VIAIVADSKFVRHWRRLDKHIGKATPTIGRQNVVKSDKCVGDSQILGGASGLPPKSTPMRKES